VSQGILYCLFCWGLVWCGKQVKHVLGVLAGKLAAGGGYRCARDDANARGRNLKKCTQHTLS